MCHRMAFTGIGMGLNPALPQVPLHMSPVELLDNGNVSWECPQQLTSPVLVHQGLCPSSLSPALQHPAQLILPDLHGNSVSHQGSMQACEGGAGHREGTPCCYPCLQGSGPGG
jgi:hypothetical protein